MLNVLIKVKLHQKSEMAVNTKMGFFYVYIKHWVTIFSGSVKYLFQTIANVQEEKNLKFSN